MDTLDWGKITPEGVNRERNQFTYVYNHDLENLANVERTIRFIIGRLFYYDKHLPKGPIHNVKIDIRGQKVAEDTCDFISNELKSKYSRQQALNIEFIK